MTLKSLPKFASYLGSYTVTFGYMDIYKLLRNRGLCKKPKRQMPIWLSFRIPYYISAPGTARANKIHSFLCHTPWKPKFLIWHFYSLAKLLRWLYNL